MSNLKGSRRGVVRPSDRDEVRALRRQVARLRRENELQRRRLETLVGLIAVLRVNVGADARAQLVLERRQAGIGWLCRVLGLERTRFFRWRRGREALRNRAAADDAITARIVEIHTHSGGTYGAARVTAVLRREGLVVNRKNGWPASCVSAAFRA